mgnify:CR=1 FL=1
MEFMKGEAKVKKIIPRRIDLMLGAVLDAVDVIYKNKKLKKWQYTYRVGG